MSEDESHPRSSAVIWCVFFGGDVSWLSKRKSGILFGVSEVAGRIVDRITVRG